MNRNEAFSQHELCWVLKQFGADPMIFCDTGLLLELVKQDEDEYWEISPNDTGWYATIMWDHQDGPILLFQAEAPTLCEAVQRCTFANLWEREYWKQYTPAISDHFAMRGG